MEPELPRPHLDGNWDDSKNLTFQVIDWYVPEDDKVPKIKSYKDRYGFDYPEEQPQYQVYMFGVTGEGHSVCLKVNQFEPSFFVQLPTSQWEGKSKAYIQEKIKQHKQHLLYGKYESTYYGKTTERRVIPYKLQSHLSYAKLVYRKDFWGFNNGEEFPFLKIKVKSLALYNALKWYYTKELVPKQGYKLYESNINPLLRFMHERKIDPCGWVRLNGGTYEVLSDEGDEIPMSRCQINAVANYSDVHLEKKNVIAPLLIASFDIECTSSHGDFPVARKSYMKLAQDLVQYTKMRGCPTKELLYQMLMNAFDKNTDYNSQTIHQVFPKKIQSPGRIHALVNGLLDSAYSILQSISPSDNNDDDMDVDMEDAESDHENENVGGVEEDKKTTHERELCRILDGRGGGNVGLPELQGDPLIQIGTTVHRYGSDDIVYKHIITLKSCKQIDGVVVESYDKEEDVLLAWKDFIARLDPDILIGYNIFGFDMEYMWQRAMELDCVDEFSMGLGRLCARRVWLDEQKLASSALGSNFLKYISLDGVVTIDMYKVLQRDQKLDSYKLDAVATLFLGDQKNDLKPHEIFEKYKGNSTDRAEIASYCIQDCCLVNRLLHKLKVLENNVGMGNVCSVPLSYLFMRGQGVKIFSLVAKYCRSLQMLIPVVRNFNEESLDDNGVGYEGAIVLPPKIGMYLDDPITVFDFSSLYPSSMIERDLSHDRILLNPEKYGNLQEKGIEYITVTYDEYSGSGDKKVISGKKDVVFAKMPNNEKGVIPSILMELLKQRKNTRKKMEYETVVTEDGQYTGLVSEKDCSEGTMLCILDVEKQETKTVSKTTVCNRFATYNAFEEAVLDALQLAYKITANSLYGQIGAKTSPIYLKEIAASTTATGRERIMMAKKFMEDNYGADVIYGDTDSIFCKFPCKDEHGHIVKGREALPLAIRAGQIGAKAIKSILPPPQSLEYEKTLFPFIIFSKKRYVGNLYEDDANKKPKQKSMGIVLKRRDNAPIVKKVYGGIIDCLVNKYSLPMSIEFLQKYLKDIVDGKVPLEDLIITKTLGASYKDPTKIAHRVLADRMAVRDPGNKPQVNDRIPFAYIVPQEGTDIKLQGDRVEHPDYIREAKLTPDYRFYLTNQIIKPVCQIYGLCVEQLPGYDCTEEYWTTMEHSLKVKPTYQNDDRKLQKKILDMREKMAAELLFGESLSRLPEVVMKKKTSSKKKTSVLPTVRGKKQTTQSHENIEPDIQLYVSTDSNEKKKWVGTTEIIKNGESVWKQTIEREKGRTKDKISSAPKFYILLCESGLIHILDKPEWKASIIEKGIELSIDKDSIVSELNKSMRQFDQYETMMETIVESGDIGKLTEFRENNLYRNIAGFLKGIQYKVNLK